MPGPAPDPNALRRDRKDDKGTWTLLPRERSGDPPPWPFSRQTAREKAMWAEEWRRPQAVMWERDHQEREVAYYVKNALQCEGSPDAKLLPILMRQQEALGLSQPGLMRRRWKIEDEAEPTTRTHANSDRAATKASLRAIAGGAA